MTPEPVPPRGFPAAWVPKSAGAELCRRFCSRLAKAGTGDPIRGRPISWDGIALCRRFCRGFAARQAVIVVRRPRRRAARKEAT
jgi:hypothetical protein